ncbi:MAG: DUF1295 domain-containing protein [Deltaproteobacteria bacterium]|nr:MAG: DUF1295 domain-containing protein [Deltaproteobacteria bacterium]
MLWCWIGCAAAVFALLFFVRAPYGRYVRRGWGPLVGRRTGWILMELPSAIGMPLAFWLGNRHTDTAAIVFLSLWSVHYFHRTFIYPLGLARGQGHTLTTVAMAWVFNSANVFFNGYWLFHAGPVLGASWLGDPRFVAGLVVFVAGFVACKHSDAILRRLRRNNPGEYKIPEGGLFRWISCPNYLGEIVEWLGWAILTWSLAGLSFAIWTVANLAPRAWHHHRWYMERFAEYPKNRKALVPFIF